MIRDLAGWTAAVFEAVEKAVGRKHSAQLGDVFTVLLAETEKEATEAAQGVPAAQESVAMAQAALDAFDRRLCVDQAGAAGLVTLRRRAARWLALAVCEVL